MSLNAKIIRTYSIQLLFDQAFIGKPERKTLEIRADDQNIRAIAIEDKVHLDAKILKQRT